MLWVCQGGSQDNRAANRVGLFAGIEDKRDEPQPQPPATVGPDDQERSGKRIGPSPRKTPALY
jgi:hypothetical protein